MSKPKSQQGPAVSSPEAANKESKPTKPTDRTLQVGEHIGRELRAMFDDVVSEPVPERFRNLLEELERKESKD